jgi:hypothetical protein
LLIKSDSENISEPSTDIVTCIGMNDKHSSKINLKNASDLKILNLFGISSKQNPKNYFKKFKC